MITQSIPLSMAIPGKEYIIKHISCNAHNFKGFEGYGISPGTSIKLIFSSPSKDPSAYEVMGAVLALRCEDSKKIFITPV